MERFEFQIEETFHRRRLDEFLFHQFSEYSKAYLREILKEEQCQLNGEYANGGRLIRTGDFLEIVIDSRRAKAMKPQYAPIKVLYEDNDLIAIDKETGILVHPTHRERDGTLLNAVAFHVNQKQGARFVRPLPVHRIDRETSGIVLFALNPRSTRIISKQIRDRKVEKEYLALVNGVSVPEKGKIDKPISRDPERKLHFVSEAGPSALTEFEVLKTDQQGSLLRVFPQTGRTNQIRVHFADAGFPIVGDQLYGGKEYRRLCLHAAKIRIKHPTTGETLQIESVRVPF